jgi:hypothetical protein
MYLSDLRRELRQLLRTDPLGFIGQECRVLADKVPESFPKTQVLHNYAEPLTSWSWDGSQAIAVPMVRSCEADISGLALFCSQRLGWVPLVVHQKFETCVWPGACLRSLCTVSSVSILWHGVDIKPFLYYSDRPAVRLSCSTSGGEAGDTKGIVGLRPLRQDVLCQHCG